MTALSMLVMLTAYANAADSVDDIVGLNGKRWGAAPSTGMTCTSITPRVQQCVEPIEIRNGVVFRGIQGAGATYMYFDAKLVSFTVMIHGQSTANSAIAALDRAYGRHDNEGHTFGWPGNKVLLSIRQGDGRADGRIDTPSTRFWMLTASSIKYQAGMAAHILQSQ